MESSNEPVSPFDPYEHVANLTLHEESPLKVLAKPTEPPEYKPRSSSSAASARGRLEGHDDASSVSHNGTAPSAPPPPLPTLSPQHPCHSSFVFSNSILCPHLDLASDLDMEYCTDSVSPSEHSGGWRICILVCSFKQRHI